MMTQVDIDALRRDVDGWLRIPADCEFGAGCVFGSRCVFGPGCRFRPGCRFGPGCRFRPGCVFGPGCRFGAGMRFGLGCMFGPRCVFGEDCRFAPSCVFCAGCVLAPPTGTPIVPDIDRAILRAVESNGALDMSTWHTCATTHCRAGWAITLAGDAGRALEERYGPCAAGAMIYAASRPGVPIPDFYESDADALADLRKCAGGVE